MSHTGVDPLGAFVLAVADRMQEAVEAVARHGASGPAALVALHGYAGGESIDGLRRILGITHSGAVRLVDRLAAAELVERRIGSDARALSLYLTPNGRRVARRVLAAREAALEQALAPLSAAERQRLNFLLSAMLAEFAGTVAEARRVCRLCDAEGCRHVRGECPVTQAVDPVPDPQPDVEH